MSKIIAVVEGITEQSFVREVLAPWLWDKGRVELVASPAGKPGKKGGNSYGKVKSDLIKHLKNPHFTTVTTLFDFYGMPLKWPGRTEALKKSQANKPLTVEKAIFCDIEAAVGAERAEHLIPYIQMHEFEALLFSDTTSLPDIMRKPKAKEILDEIRMKYSTPEEINDSSTTAPSKRIGIIFPYYQKPLHGVLAAKRITVETMMQHCPHFQKWVTVLKATG